MLLTKTIFLVTILFSVNELLAETNVSTKRQRNTDSHSSPSAQSLRHTENSSDQKTLFDNVTQRLDEVIGKHDKLIQEFNDPKTPFFFPKGVEPDFPEIIKTLNTKLKKQRDKLKANGSQNFNYQKDTKNLELIAELDVQDQLVDYVREQGKILQHIKKSQKNPLPLPTDWQEEAENARLEALKNLATSWKKKPPPFSLSRTQIPNQWKDQWANKTILVPDNDLRMKLQIRDSIHDSSLIPEEVKEQFSGSPEENPALIVQAIYLMQAAKNMSENP